MNDNSLYDGILRDLSSGEFQSLDRRSQTLQDIFMHLEIGTTTTAFSLIPKLDDLEYEQNRAEIAKLAGVRPSALDKLRRQDEKQKNEGKLQGRALSLPEPVPAPEPQDGAKLLDDIAAQIRRFVAADVVSIDAIMLWIVFAHIAQKAPVCPNLVFSSAVKACGKSTALDVVSRLVPKPLSVSNISVAALFRTVELLSPTLLIDEADAMFRQNDDLRTLVNAGFTKSAAQVVRIVGDDNEPRLFTVYAPKAIALIGSLPDTIESRSVIIRMRRRLPDEPIERLRSDRDQGFQPLLARIARWTLDNADEILAQEPEIDPSLSDRQADVWRELLRIADFAGCNWPQRARIAALELCAKQTDEGDLGIRLLVDIQRIFSEQPDRQKWPTQTIANELNALDDAAWSEFNAGRGIRPNKISRILTHFDIKPTTIREGNKTAKGYLVDAFAEAFLRYLPQKGNNVTNTTNYLQDNGIKCYEKVTVTFPKSNIQNDGQLFDSTGEAFEERPTFTNDDLAIVGRVFEQLVESEKARTGGNTVGICIAAWRLASAVKGVSFGVFDAAKAYYDKLGYLKEKRGYVQLTA